MALANLYFQPFPIPSHLPSPQRKHDHSFLPYPRAFNSSGNTPRWLLTKNQIKTKTKIYPIPNHGPCPNPKLTCQLLFYCFCFTSRLCTPLIFSRLIQKDSTVLYRAFLIFDHVSNMPGSYWGQVLPILSFRLARALKC